MKGDTYIRKANGEHVLFNRNKLLYSLIRSGAREDVAEQIAEEIELDLFNGMRTQKIYERAFKLLKMRNRPAASTYQLKKAVMELGPTGFPFEHLVASIYREEGYRTKTGVVLQGKCVYHEVDVLVESDTEVRFVECKFHNQSGVKSDVKVALYVHSRINDLKERWLMDNPEERRFISGGLVTNTKLTDDARTYARCSGLWGLGWDSPDKDSLLEKIKRHHLLPITMLHHLSKKEKQEVLNAGITLCRELVQQREVLETLGMEIGRMERVISEADNLMQNYV
jgi:Holliday junction resolvase-like predicted endonuclease